MYCDVALIIIPDISRCWQNHWNCHNSANPPLQTAETSQGCNTQYELSNSTKHGWVTQSFWFTYFSISFTTWPLFSSTSHSSCSLSLLDFVHVLALGNELLGDVVSWVMFVNDEGAGQKLSATFQRWGQLTNFYVIIVSVAESVSAKSDMSLAGIEQLQ